MISLAVLIWVKTNMHSEQDAEAQIDTGIFSLKLKNFFQKAHSKSTQQVKE